MNIDVTQWVISQGIGAVLAAVMFAIYRQDSKAWAAKQSESAAAFMEFGERYAARLADVAATMARQSTVLDRIEENLRANHICPVTQELLRESAVDAGHKRRAIDRIVADAMRAKTSQTGQE